VTTPEERAKPLKFRRPLGAAIGKLISIVTVGTFHRWVRDAEEADGKPARKPRPGGRPRIDENIRALILKLARACSLGYTRILGEVRKLGICGKVCRQTVKNVLREEGVDTGPARSETTWD
jgi:putative transposase